MLLLLGFLLVFIFGYLLSSLLVGKMYILERLGTSFLIGFGIFTLLMFCYSTLGVRITTQSTFTALIIGIVTLIVLLKIFRRKIKIAAINFASLFTALTLQEKIAVLVIGGLVIGSLTITQYFPVNSWDSIVLYDFRAKIIAQQGFYAQIANNFSYFAGYPLFTSLSHTLIYLFGGENPQFLYSLMYVSFIFIFYTNLRVHVGKSTSLLATMLLAATPAMFDHSTFAYTNLPYTIFLASGSIYLFNWISKKKDFGFLLLSAVFTGLSTWTRSSEPFWIINILILVLSCVYRFKQYILPTAAYVLLFFLIKEPWNSVNLSQSVAVSVAPTTALTAQMGYYVARTFNITINPARMGEVLTFIYKSVIVTWYPHLFLFLLTVFLNRRKFFEKSSSFFLSIIFLYFSVLLFSAYVFSFSFSEWRDIPGSAERMAMFFIPLMVYYIGLSLEPKNKT
jgi:hypothetical protein